MLQYNYFNKQSKIEKYFCVDIGKGTPYRAPGMAIAVLLLKAYPQPPGAKSGADCLFQPPGRVMRTPRPGGERRR